MNTIVIALGGNALLTRGQPLEAEIQRKNITLAAKAIAKVAEENHSNNPRKWPTSGIISFASGSLSKSSSLSS